MLYGMTFVACLNLVGHSQTLLFGVNDLSRSHIRVLQHTSVHVNLWIGCTWPFEIIQNKHQLLLTKRVCVVSSSLQVLTKHMMILL